MYLLLTLELGVLIGGLAAATFAIVWLISEFRGMRDEIKARTGINNEALKLKLQAFERLTVYAERAGLKNLVSRIANEQGIDSAAMLHYNMIESLKTEFDYNVSQQIYVSPEVWNAITKLKDQNIFIINQLAAGLPSGASALELNKRLLEYSMNNNAELNKIVLEAISFEAKQALQKAG